MITKQQSPVIELYKLNWTEFKYNIIDFTDTF